MGKKLSTVLKEIIWHHYIDTIAVDEDIAIVTNTAARRLGEHNKFWDYF